MTGPAQPIEWYLARDNKQYGPLSDVELMKLVELRHLRELDLVWRAGFSDWTPAPIAFPQAFAQAEPPLEAAAPAAAPETGSAPPAHEPAPSEVAAKETAAPAPAPRPSDPAPQAAYQPTARAEPVSQAPAPAKIETLAEYRARQGARQEALHAHAPVDQAAPAGPALRAATEAEAQRAGGDRSRAGSPQRRMWIAPADPEPSAPSPTAAHQTASTQPHARLDPGPSLLTHPQRQQPALDYGYAQRTGEPRPGPGLSPQPGFADRGGPQWPDQPKREPQFQLPSHDAHAQPQAPATLQPQMLDDGDGYDEEDPPRRPRRILGLMAILTLLALMVAGIWIALMHPQLIRQPMRALGLSGTSVSTPAEPSAARASSPASREQAASAAKLPTSASLKDFPESPTAIDELLQKGRLWSIVRGAFPEWYDERVREAARLVAEKKSDEAVTKHLIDALVALRRKNADHAFQASLPKLEQVARTFRDNLEVLTKHSHVACFALISSGESTRGMVTLFRDPAYGPSLQSGLAAVFEAVADGRANPRTNLPAKRSDYDMLTKELQALGWSEQDIGLFSDSEALAKTPPEQVCKLVREWFTAHLAIVDKEVRQRLLIESIKPVVAG
jgi:hypothetical protein